MGGQDTKVKVRDRILIAMKEHLPMDVLAILETVLAKEFAAVSMEEMSLLPVDVRNSVEEQNRQIVELFKYKKRNLKPATIDNYLRAVGQIATMTGKVLTRIDDMDIYNYLQWYENRNMSITGKRNQNSTINNERLYLSAFFSWMRKNRLRTDNPVEVTERRKVVRKPIDYFKRDDMAKLRDACQTTRDRALVEVLRSTGARVNEITAITTDMIDWQTGDIVIQSEKSDKYRTIWLDDDARYYLRKYLDSRADNVPYLFVHSRGAHGQLKAGGIRTILKDLKKRSEIKGRAYPHKFRKTLGMELKNRGADIGLIQEIMGHASPAVTCHVLCRIYTRITSHCASAVHGIVLEKNFLPGNVIENDPPGVALFTDEKSRLKN